MQKRQMEHMMVNCRNRVEDLEAVIGVRRCEKEEEKDESDSGKRSGTLTNLMKGTTSTSFGNSWM